MPSVRESPEEMMPQLLALKGLIADSLVVSEDVDPSVIGPETLRFCTTEQMRKVLNKVIKEYSNHTLADSTKERA